MAIELPGPIPAAEFLSKELDKGPIRAMLFILLLLLGVSLWANFFLLKRSDAATDALFQSELEKRQMANDALVQKFATTAQVDLLQKKFDEAQQQQAATNKALNELKKKRR